MFISLDIDECSLDTDDCQHKCVNTDGSYTCSCYPGYRLYKEQPLLIDNVPLLPNTSCYGKLEPAHESLILDT